MWLHSKQSLIILLIMPALSMEFLVQELRPRELGGHPPFVRISRIESSQDNFWDIRGRIFVNRNPSRRMR